MHSFFVGIDVSKEVIDAAVMISGQVQNLGQFKNDHNGFTKLVKDLRKITGCKSNQGFICFENTGIYSKALLEYLVSQQIQASKTI